MAELTFTCNSFRFIYWFKLKLYFFFSGREKTRKKFIQQLAQYFQIDQEQVFLYGAARMGLYSLLKSLKLTTDDEVIVSGYTCVVVTNAVKYAGAKVTYVDVTFEDLNFNIQKLFAAITDNTKAIVVPHNFGIVTEVIEEIKFKYPEIFIIEDAAHTFGSVNSKGLKAGLLGDASFFSFEFSKPLTTGMGGLVIVNNKQIIPNLTKEYSILPELNFSTRFKIICSLYLHNITSYTGSWVKSIIFAIFRNLGLVYVTPAEELDGDLPKHYPVKLHPTLCALGLFQMQDIKKIIEQKKKILESYSFIFGAIHGIKTYYKEEYDFVRFPIVFPEEIPISIVKEIKLKLADQKYSVGDWFNDVVHPKGSYRYCYNNGDCNTGESISERIINLPVNISRKMDERDIQQIANIIELHIKGKTE